MKCFISHPHITIDGNVHLWRSAVDHKWFATLQDVETGKIIEQKEATGYLLANTFAHDMARRHNTHVMEVQDGFLSY